MNPGIVSAAVVVVGAIAAALFYVFQEQPNVNSYNGPNYNYNRTNNNTSNYHSSDRTNGSKKSIINRKKQKKVTLMNHSCVICMENLFGEIEITSCKHAYHAKCMEEYLQSQSGTNQTKPGCPICRQSLE